MSTHTFKHVILGGGLTAGYAAKEFAERGIDDVAIVSAERYAPYNRPPLSKGFLAGETPLEEIYVNEPDFYKENGIELMLNTTVDSVDFDKKQLHTQSGDVIQYDKLLLATGSQVRKLDIPHAEIEGIHYLRDVGDSRSIQSAIKMGSLAVVIGGGYIGMETSAVMAQKRIKVAMLFPESRLMEWFFTPEISAFFHDYYVKHGVTIRTGVLPGSFMGVNERVEGVMLKDTDEKLPADFVLAGIGVEPVIDLYAETELDLNEEGIVVNEYLETNIADVYAAGDLAYYPDLIFDKRRHIEHWDNARVQGRHAAKVMAGEREPFKALRYFFSDIFDLSYEFWGDTEGATETVHRGDFDEASFSAWWLKDGRVIAAFVMDRPNEERKAAQKWIKQGIKVKPDMLADESNALEEAIAS
jgi:NADPH-dependent 2,4-dienoyl-CoA reductase/sulfur reductase-like enzyme